MTLALKQFRRLDEWLFSAIDARQIAALRIGLCTILLVRLFKHDFTTLANQPEGLYRPLSYMHAFSAMPSEGVTRVLFFVTVLAAFVSAIGYRSRILLPIATIGALVLFGMTTSSGKVMHNDALLVLCLLPVALGTTDNVWSIASWRRKRSNNKSHVQGPLFTSGWPWRVALLLVCGAYFFSGLAKLTHSGPAWVFSDNMRWILYANSDSRAVPNQLSLFVADHVWLARISCAGIFALEISFPLVLWRMSLRWLFVPSVVGMHLLTWLTLGLDYSAMAAVVVITMVSWSSIAPRN